MSHVSSTQQAPPHGAREAPPGGGRGWRATRIAASVICAAVAAGAIWAILTTTLAASFSSEAPTTALMLAAEDGEALVALAERGVAELPAAGRGARDTDALKHLEGLVTRSFGQRPLAAHSLYVLAQIAVRRGDGARAKALERAAVRRSLHETGAVLAVWLGYLAEGEWARAVDMMDVLLRTHPDLVMPLAPALARLSAEPGMRGPLAARLAEPPPWRENFLVMLTEKAESSAATLDLLVGLKATASPPTAQEVRRLVDLLTRKGAFEAAYFAWLQFLSDEELSAVGTLFNRDFKLALSGMPFDWTIGSGIGASAEVGSADDAPGKRVLRIGFVNERTQFGDVTQLLMLSPGRYRFAAKAKGELIGRRGLKWVVTCEGRSAAPLGETAMFIGRHSEWQELAAEVVVPPGDCAAQRLRLVLDARYSAEQFLSGTVVMQDLELKRAEAP